MKTSPSLLREPRGRPVMLPQWPRAKRPSLSRCIDFCLANVAGLRAPCSARLVGRNSEAYSATRPRRSLERVNRHPQNRWKLWPLTGLSAFVCPHGRSSAARLARLRAEWRNTLRYCALRAAQMSQNCARLAVQVQSHNFGGCAFIHKFRFFVKNFFHFFHFLLAICSLVLLSEFFEGDV
jgi:hypothetical protein